MKKNTHKGWKGIGRSLVIAVVGPEAVAEQLHDQDVVVINLEGEPLELARRRALSPDLVDVAVIDVSDREDREEWLELSRVLRGRYLSPMLILPRDRWGKRVFRNQLGVFRHSGRVVLPELWMGVSVAAQETWTLGWLRLDKRRQIREVREQTQEPLTKVIDVTVERRPSAGLEAPLAPRGGNKDAPPSSTTPWAPPPNLLVELTKAYDDQA